MRVLVGSANPVKIAAVRDAFEPCFPGAVVEGIEASSGVPAQPMGEETFTGAENRARTLLGTMPNATLALSFASGWRAASHSITAGGLRSAPSVSPTRRAGWVSAFRRCSSCRRASWMICWGAASWGM